MTKGVAVECAPFHVRVNSVHPSTVETELVAEMLKDPEKRAQRLDEIPWAGWPRSTTLSGRSSS